jgi:hypothetical protein
MNPFLVRSNYYVGQVRTKFSPRIFPGTSDIVGGGIFSGSGRRDERRGEKGQARSTLGSSLVITYSRLIVINIVKFEVEEYLHLKQSDGNLNIERRRPRTPLTPTMVHGLSDIKPVDRV